MTVKHTFQSEKADGGDTSLVRPSDWNANHTVDSGPCLLGNTAVTASGVQNITLGTGLYFNGATLNVNSSSPIIFSVLEYGAVGDGVTNDTQAFLDTLAACEAAGGGGIYIPAGNYYVTGLFIPPSNTHIFGDGMDCTILQWHDVDHCFVNVASKENIEFSDFTIVGRWDTNRTQGSKFPFLLYYIDDVKFTRVGVDYSRSMSIAVRSCDSAMAQSCRIRWSAIDAISFVDVANYIICNNEITHCGDNGIAAHCTDSQGGLTTPVRSNGVINGNRLTQTCGINALGGKLIDISDNTATLCLGYGISIGYVAAEGNTAPIGINISNNVITDVIAIGTFTSNNYIQITGLVTAGSGGTAIAAPPGQADTVTGAVIDPYPYWYDNGTAEPQAGAYFININNNQTIRTLPLASNYSDWGYGDLFTRSGWIDPAIDATALTATARGINLGGTSSLIKDMIIQGHIAHGLSSGIFFQASTRYDNILIQGCEISDVAIGAFVCASGLTGNHNVTIRNNIIDCDPYLHSANRSASIDGGWQNTDQPSALYNQNAGGFNFFNNEIRNAASVQFGSGSVLMRDNIGYCEPFAIGWNANNLGIGKILDPGERIWYTIEYSDPNVATFGQLKNTCPFDATSQPSSGNWVAGMFVRSRAIAPTASGYTLGWYRVTTGSGNTSVTDWQSVGTPSTNQTTARMGMGLLPGALNASGHFYVSTSDSNPVVTIEQAGTGDTTINWVISGVKSYQMGVDNSDGDKLKIGDGTNGFTDPLLSFTPANNEAEFFGPIKAPGPVICSQAALTTSATTGFLYIPTCAGTPTGVPSTNTGTVALVFNTTSSLLHVYSGGWKSVAVT